MSSHLVKYALIFYSDIYSETIILCSESPRKRIPRTVWWIQWSNLILLACTTSLLPAQEQGHHVASSGDSIHVDSVLSLTPYDLLWSHHCKVPTVKNPSSKGAELTNLGATGSSSPKMKNKQVPRHLSRKDILFFWLTDGKIKPQKPESKERYFTELD